MRGDGGTQLVWEFPEVDKPVHPVVRLASPRPTLLVLGEGHHRSFILFGVRRRRCAGAMLAGIAGHCAVIADRIRGRRCSFVLDAQPPCGPS
ncbi:hypothetical protein G6F57_017670 [Rhizopus arrhizus]|nr:hypothetical protein G6F63_016841 [Rhizopus arrhizus]KAG1445052.1 hypothetical protein G6F57_017670 [Rhizopus arrhizus]